MIDRQPLRSLGSRIEFINFGVAVLTAGKRQEVPIGRQRRRNVQAGHRHQRPAFSGRKLEDVDILGISAPVGREHNEPTIRRPTRHQIEKSVRGDLFGLIPIVVHHEQFTRVAVLGDIHNFRASDPRLSGITKHQFIGKPVRHQPHDRGRTHIAFSTDNLVASAVIDEAVHQQFTVLAAVFLS